LFVQGNQGYYRYWFWEGAVPDQWETIPNIGGYPWSTGGYYTQWFWLHAAPDQWTADQSMAIGGVAGAGYYDYSFYHFATVRDFAWRNSLSIAGSSGAGYFDFWYHGQFGQSMPHYQHLLDLSGGYLRNASTFRPVSSWFSPTAHAVVAFTFDTEGTEAETCAVTNVLHQQGITAAFYLVGLTADVLTPTWIQCLSGMDIENHTQRHPGGFDLGPQTWIDTYPNAVQIGEIRDNVPRVRAQIPTALMTSFRTPNCDSNKAFDQSVIQNSIASGMESDRSVATITNYARGAGVVPALGLSLFSLSAFPSPFVVGTSSTNQLVEFPFTYPSDWTAGNINGLNNQQAPPSAGDPRYAVTVWEREFDEIYNQNGVMVVLMHPWIQGANGRFPDGLNALINYMKSKPGVVFSTAAAVNLAFRAATALTPAAAAP
jgi:peptidoglycan/xylan/chitin deacetylase (PgdA/CDA1 family)